MDSKVKEEWVTALRSGRYEQGQHELRTAENKFCCLGVLCDIAGAEWQYLGTNGIWAWQAVYNHTPSNGYVPLPLERELNITLSVQKRLIKYNDEGKSFEDIADYIENSTEL